jgi:hypothetical protein
MTASPPWNRYIDGDRNRPGIFLEAYVIQRGGARENAVAPAASLR